MNVLRLREMRKKTGLNQLQIAELLDVTQSYYSRWESGKRLPDAKQILSLCEIFRCTPNDLYGVKGEYVVGMHKIQNQ